MPASITTPGKPQNLTATTDETGAIVVQCDAIPLATRYRWRMRFVGVQADYRLAARSTDPIATIVQAVNEGPARRHERAAGFHDAAAGREHR